MGAARLFVLLCAIGIVGLTTELADFSPIGEARAEISEDEPIWCPPVIGHPCLEDPIILQKLEKIW